MKFALECILVGTDAATFQFPSDNIVSAQFQLAISKTLLKDIDERYGKGRFPGHTSE